MLKQIKARFSKPVWQPLNQKCLNGKVDEVKKALAKGEDPNSRGIPLFRCCYEDCRCCHLPGKTPLMAATIGNHPKVVALLLSQPGIEVNVKCGTSGKTALHFAMEKGRDAALSLLLVAPGPGVDLNATDGFEWTGIGSTPIQDAIHYCNVDAVRLMASVAEVDLDVKTPRGECLEDLAHIK